MEIVYYISHTSEQNSVRNDYNTQQKSNLEPHFCRTYIFQKSVNNMGILLCNNLPSHFKIRVYNFVGGN